MGAFERVVSLSSFVYALAIAHLLTTAAKLLTNRERVATALLRQVPTMPAANAAFKAPVRSLQVVNPGSFKSM